MPRFNAGDRLVDNEVVLPLLFGKACTVITPYSDLFSNQERKVELEPNVGFAYKVQFDGYKGFLTLSWEYVDERFELLDKAVEKGLCK